jgi:Protein of unknown function (DUF1566)
MYKNFTSSLLLTLSSLISAYSFAEAGQVTTPVENKKSSAKSTTQAQNKKSATKATTQVQTKKPSAKAGTKVQRKKSSAKAGTKVQRKKSSAKVATQLQTNESSVKALPQLPSYEYSTKLTTQPTESPAKVEAPVPAYETPAKVETPVPAYEPPVIVLPSYVSSAKVETPIKDASGLDARGLWQDPKSKLIWSRCSLGQEWTGRECSGIPQRLNWNQAHEAAKSYSFDGQQDWRLPTYKELLSLRLLNAGDPEAIDSPWFYKPDATDGYGWYWSSKPYGYFYSNYAWAVDLDIGKGEFIDKKRSARIFLVREPK